MNTTLLALFLKGLVKIRCKHYSLFIVMFLCNSTQIIAQEEPFTNVESSSYQNDSALAYFHFKRFEANVKALNDSAIFHARQSKALAEKINDSLLIVRSAYALGFLFKERGNYQVAQNYYLESLKIAEGHKNDFSYSERVKSIYNGLGLAYYNDGIYQEALRAYFKSIDIRKAEINEGLSRKDANLGLSYTNLGLVYYKLGDLERAIDYQHQALKEYIDVNANDLAENYVNLGLAYSQMVNYAKRYEGDYSEKMIIDSAIYYFQKANLRCEYFEECSPNTQFEMFNGLGLVYEKIDLIDSSLYYLNKAGEAFPSAPNRVIVLHNKSQVELNKKNYSESIYFADQAQLIIDSAELKSLKPTNYYLFAEIYEKQKNYKKAYKYYRSYDSLDQLLFNEKVLSGTKSLEIEYAESSNLQQIREQKSKIKEQEKSLLLSAIIIGLISFIGIILYRNNLQRKKANNQLFQANKIIEEQNQQLKNMNNVLEERVRERTKELKTANVALKQSNMELDNFIYKTSHDIRGPLATLQGICNVALMDVQDAKSIDYLQKLGKTASRLNEILSKLLVINQINNSVISQDPIDFELIVDHVVQDNRKTNAADIAVIKEINPQMKFLSDHDLIKIIIANLVNNAFKFYNQSSRVESFVKIGIDSDRINLNISIVDNGIGIDEQVGDKIFEIFSKASEMSDSAGLGLYLVKLSVEKLKGRIILKRTREGYTEFKVKIPLNQDD
ncbi:tetratricopeptide repeat-containing sensor histidine kinase [Fulvivirga sedimenti]|uniref:histidine kinase n=1 Tax=Fulvivirga sedimenti TaxID=2879465 RepID=A0A9X1KX09_9BACT|nr:tetratricopeptide repeat-containing sensor histidine kinase [Fulvivirga sedimenti]MCA6073787.1 tetratricopeptide repeat-containing sensor histidine kinase [Fulvivirga sedimenti]